MNLFNLLKRWVGKVIEEKFYCERCGKELVFRCGYSKIDHKLICVECGDKEQPKELMKKIAELEAELAESESKAKTYEKEIVFLDKKLENLNKEFELAQEHIEKTVEYWQNKCSQLRQQLAEKDATIKYLKDEKDGSEQANELLNKMFIEVKEELEEKEKENSVLKAVIDKNKTGQFGAVNICNAISEFYEPLVKDMIIAELKKVKEYWLKHEDIGYYVDQQIKSLKGEK